MRNHLRPLVKGAGGEKQQHNGNTLLYRRSAACVNKAAHFDRLTARVVLERFHNGTLDVAVIEALLLGVGLEA